MTIVCAVSSVVVALVARRKRRRPRSCWVPDWLQKRPQHGTHVALLSSLRSSDPSTYRNFCRMAPDDYDELLRMVRPAITRSDTKYRKAISWATCIHLYPVCVYTWRCKWNGYMYPKQSSFLLVDTIVDTDTFCIRYKCKKKKKKQKILNGQKITKINFTQ